MLGEDGALNRGHRGRTGHGTRAGIMVAIMKGLFARLCYEPDLRTVLRECSRTLKGIELDPMYMALGSCACRDWRRGRWRPPCRRSSCCGPPRSGRTDHRPGLLLGTGFEVPWEEVRSPSPPGTGVLLMSDGFLEQMDGAEDMLDYERGQAYFREASAEGAPEAIIESPLPPVRRPGAARSRRGRP